MVERAADGCALAFTMVPHQLPQITFALANSELCVSSPIQNARNRNT